MLIADRALLPQMTMMLLKRLIRGLLPQMTRDPINVDNDDLHHELLGTCQRRNDKGKDTEKDHPILLQELQ